MSFNIIMPKLIWKIYNNFPDVTFNILKDFLQFIVLTNLVVVHSCLVAVVLSGISTLLLFSASIVITQVYNTILMDCQVSLI